MFLIYGYFPGDCNQVNKEDECSQHSLVMPESPTSQLENKLKTLQTLVDKIKAVQKFDLAKQQLIINCYFECVQ